MQGCVLEMLLAHLALNRTALRQIQTGLLVVFWKISSPKGERCQRKKVRPVCSAPSNPAVKALPSVAGTLRDKAQHSAPYLRR